MVQCALIFRSSWYMPLQVSIINPNSTSLLILIKGPGELEGLLRILFSCFHPNHNAGSGKLQWAGWDHFQ